MARLHKDHVWAVIGLIAVGFSAVLLYRQLKGLSLHAVLSSLLAISLSHWLLAGLSTVAAYGALACYDGIALRHLRKQISWQFITGCSFTAYALAHNIGASVVSGGIVRYRAYSSRGLSGPEVGVLVAFCSFTFALGCIMLGGLVLLAQPDLPGRFIPGTPLWVAPIAGAGLLALVVLYVLGSWRQFRPLHIRQFSLEYPRLRIVTQQLVVAPVELLGAAGIIYFALPAASNPGFLLVLGIFLASFSAALLSHAPGGLGVLEVMFLMALPDIDPADLVAALVAFRLFYLLAPLALSLLLVVLFERGQWRRRLAANTLERPSAG